MQVFHIDPALAKKDERPVIDGDVWRQPITDKASETIRVGVVDFKNGSHSRMHSHDGDQVLVIMEGEGLYKTETEEVHVKAGDVLLFKAGEVHMHGAAPGKDCKQLGIRAVKGGDGSNTKVV